MKKQRQLILLTLLLTSLTTHGQSVRDKFQDGDLEYEITSITPNNEVAVAGYTSSSTKDTVNIPQTVEYDANTYTVTSIDHNAFRGKRLARVTIPNTVISIGSRAFEVPVHANATLTEVIFESPSSLKSIGGRAFKGHKIENIELPETLVSIGQAAFANGSLTSVKIPDSVTVIATEVFKQNQLTSVEIPDSVTAIGGSAFSGNQLTELTIPVVVDTIGDWAFGNNQTLATVKVEASDPPGLGRNVFSLTPNNITVDIKDKIDLIVPEGTIQAYEDAGWTGFKSITEPAEVNDTFTAENKIEYKITSIAPSPNTVTATGYDTTGVAVTIPPTVRYQDFLFEVTAIGDGAFNEKQITRVTIPHGVISIGREAFRRNQLTEVAIPGTVTSIEDAAFRHNQLGNVTIPSGVTRIGSDVFHENQLTSVDIPNGITSIGVHAFAQNLLTEVTIPGSVASIENAAFRYNQLTTVTIPDGVMDIKDSVFLNNPTLNLVIVEATTPPTLGTNVFFNNTDNSVNLVVPEGKIQAYEGAGWTGFKSITEPPAINDTFTPEYIEYKVTSTAPLEVTAIRYNTAGGTVVNIPETVDDGPNTYTVTRIGTVAFMEKGLTEVTIPASVTIIGGWAFHKNQLARATIAEGVTSIGTAAFYQNELPEVTIPSTVTHMGKFAFTNNQLTSVTIPEGMTRIDTATFRANKLTEITLPNSVREIMGEAFSYNQLTHVTLPGPEIDSIGYQSFAVNPLEVFTIEASDPPEIHKNFIIAAPIFGGHNRDQVHLVVPEGKRQAYENHENEDQRPGYAGFNWRGFKSITEPAAINNTFSAGHITYQVTALAPFEVTAIDYNAAGGTVVDIPETLDYGPNTYTVTEIGDQAFQQKGLTAVTIPGSVTAIGNSAFLSNQLTDVTIPGSVIAIGNSAFLSNQLTDVTIPNSVTSIGNNAFQANHLEHVDIPGSVTSIEAGAFSHNQLTDVTIPDGVTDIGGNAFASNPIKKVTVRGVDTLPTIVTDNTFSNRHEIDLIVPTGQEQAYKDAGWTGFRSISEPAAINNTFSAGHITYQITALAPFEVTAIDYNAAGGTVVDIPETLDYGPNTYTVTEIGDQAFQQKGLTTVTIPGSVTAIGNSAFSNNKKLTSVEISDGVTYIGESAFAQTQLTSIELPESVTSIGEYAFSDNQLTSVTTPANVRTIDRWVYSQNQLTEVTISGNVTEIALYAFLDNPDLHLVTVEADDPPVLHEHAFSNADRDQIDLVVPTGKKQKYLDNGWHGFRSISYGIFSVDNITYGITSRTEVMVVDYTGTDTEVTIPGTVYNDQDAYIYTVTAIGEGAFQNKELTQVEIPTSVTSIGERAFGDNQLTEVTLPGSVERIGFHAFYNNPDLGLVTAVANDPPELHATAFANANRHQIDLVVPTDKIQAYEDNGWGGFRSISNGSHTGLTPIILAPQSVDGLDPFTVIITFDGEVTGFESEDIQVTNAIVNDFTDSGSTYTATLTPTSSCEDNITIDVPANVVTDVNHSPNLAATQVVVATVDTIDPTITCIANVVANTGDNGMGDCTTTVDLGSPVTDDNCSVASVVAQVNGTDIDPHSYAFSIGPTTVTWIVTDGSGNITSCEQTVTVEATGNCEFAQSLPPMIPTAFTPNGDGANDTWIIDHLDEDASVRIYDRHGTIIFRSDDGYAHPWDGTYRGGSLPTGSYLYAIQNGTHTYRGTVTILL